MEAYLRLRGPFLPLLFLAAAVSAIWNELSVYELPRAENNYDFIIHHTAWNKTKTFTAARKMKRTSVISTVMGSENSLMISVSVKQTFEKCKTLFFTTQLQNRGSCNVG